MHARLVILAATALLLGADALPDEAVRRERNRLQGTWQAVSLEEDGMKADAAETKGLTLTLDGETFSARAGVVPIMSGRFKVDPAGKPKTIDLESNGPRQKGMTALGIYAFDGPTLKLCLADPGQKRPDGFGSTGGRTLIVYKRRTE